MCRAAEGSELAEFAFLKRLFEKMASKNGHAVEEAFTGAVGFGYLKDDSLWVGLSNDDWFATDNQEVALRGVSVFVEVDLESEEHVIRVHRLAVGEFQAFAQEEGVSEAVGRHFPGFGKSGLGELSGAIDVDEIRLHDADDFAGAGVGGNQRIEGLWFAAQSYDEMSAGAANFSGEDEHFLFRMIL